MKKINLKIALFFTIIFIVALCFSNKAFATVIDRTEFSIDIKDSSIDEDTSSGDEYKITFISDNYGGVINGIRLGGDGFTEEELDSFKDSIQNMTDDETTEIYIRESYLTKVNGCSAMFVNYIQYTNSYGAIYSKYYLVQADSNSVALNLFAFDDTTLNSTTCNQIINSLKIKDTIKKQNGGLPFQDVNSNQWYYNSVKYVFDNGLITGLNAYTYGPDVNLSRCMLVTILWRMSGTPSAKGNVSFPDIKSSDWYYTPVIWAAENRIVNGYGNGKFGPNDNISREQLATILMNYARFRGKNVSNLADISSYKDSKRVADWAIPGIRWAIQNKVMSGKESGTKIDPQGNATRSEAAAMIMNFCLNVLK